MGMFSFIRKGSLRFALAGRSRARKAKHLRRALDRVLGAGDADPEENGEYFVLDHVARFLADRPCLILDVGANVGEWTLALSERLGNSEAAIYAFEPCAESYERLEQALLPYERFVPVHCGLGEQDASAELHLYGEASVVNSMFRRSDPALESQDTEHISIKRAEDWCRAQQIDQIDFIKIDTEGNEMAVLRGLGTLVEQQRVGCIQLEYNETWIDARQFLEQAFLLLQRSGYVLAKIHPHGIRVIDRYEPQLDDFRYSNYLAMAPAWIDVVPRIK